MKKFPAFFGLILGILYVVTGLVSLPNYGVNWDEPAHFMRGQAFFRFLFTGRQDYSGLPELDLKNYKLNFGYEFRDEQTGRVIRRSIYQHWERTLPFYYTWEIEKRGTHPAFSDVMAALFNNIFFVKLGVAPDVHSYNYYVVFVSGALVAGLYIWMKRRFDTIAAAVSSLSLALFPVFWAESHYNVKDVPQAVFYSFAMMALYEAVVQKKIKFVWLFALMFGSAFATKFNAVFILPTILLWLISRCLILYPQKLSRAILILRSHKAFFLTFLAVPFVAVFLWVVTFPAAWFEPKLLALSISYYNYMGRTAGATFSLYSLYYLLFTTPPVILIYAAAGIALPFLKGTKREKDFTLFAVSWLLVPIVRVMLPHTVIYGGVRQIMEYIPAMAVLSGIGASWIFRLLVGNRKRANLTLGLQAAALLSFLPITLKMISIHPNEGVYFNSLIGGLKGAKEHNIPDWGQTLGNPYRQGIVWINEHAEQGAKLALVYEQQTNVPYIWVRNDLIFENRTKSGPLRLGEYIMTVTNKSDFLDRYRLRELETFVDPVYQVAVDDVTILKVWKNDRDHVKEEYKDMEEEKLSSVTISQKDLSVRVTLPTARRLLRIELENDNPLLCREINDHVGIIQLYESDTLTRPRIFPASGYDYNDQLIYREPFFLFAAELAKVVDINLTLDHPCYRTIKAAQVYVVKE